MIINDYYDYNDYNDYNDKYYQIMENHGIG
jgi:hypothetical protein